MIRRASASLYVGFDRVVDPSGGGDADVEAVEEPPLPREVFTVQAQDTVQ